MSRVRNALSSALASGAAATRTAAAVDRGEETPANGEAAFQELMGVEGQGHQARERFVPRETEQGQADDCGKTNAMETGREDRVARSHRGVDAVLDGLTRSQRRPDGQARLTGRLERAPTDAGAASVRAAAGQPDQGSPAATGGPGASPQGAVQGPANPDSFAESIRTGAFRGRTTRGSEGIRAWVRAWQGSSGSTSGEPGVGADGPTEGPGAAHAGPQSLGSYLKRMGRIRGGQQLAGLASPGAVGAPSGKGLAGATGAAASEAAKTQAPRSWAATLRSPQQLAAASAPGGTEAAPATQAPAPTTAAAEVVTPVAGAAATPAGAASTGASGPAAPAGPTAAAGASPGTGFAQADPGAEAGGVRIRVPTSGGETVRGRMYMDADSRSVRVVLAVQEGGTAQSMSSAHELLRVRLAEEGYQLQSFVVRHEGRAIVRFEDEVMAQLAGDGGRDADQPDPRDEAETRSRMGRERTGQGTAAAAARPEETVASGWFL